MRHDPKPSSVLQVSARFKRISRLIHRANALAVECPEIVELLVNHTGQQAREVLKDGDACAQLRFACQSYLDGLAAAAASPLAKLSESFSQIESGAKIETTEDATQRTVKVAVSTPKQFAP